MLAEVSRRLGERVDWRPFGHGSSNRLLAGTLRGQRLLLRIDAPPERAFGVRRDTERRLLEAIDGRRWAPRVVATAPGWLVMHRHQGRGGRERATVDALLRAVADWQSRRWSLPATDYDRLWRDYRNALPAARHGAVDRLVRAVAALPPRPATLVHHDLHPGNLLRTRRSLRVIDWEYGGLGNPWFDAAALQRRFGVGATAIGRLPAFTGVPRDELVRGLALAASIVGGLDALWYEVRGEPADGL